MEGSSTAEVPAGGTTRVTVLLDHLPVNHSPLVLEALRNHEPVAVEWDRAYIKQLK
jgi:hypothetical protein